MALSTKEKKQLRARGQTMDEDARLGKGGLSEGTLGHIRNLLARQELVKVRFTELEGDERKTIAEMTAEAVDAELVALVGRTILLYRANPELAPNQRALR